MSRTLPRTVGGRERHLGVRAEARAKRRQPTRRKWLRGCAVLRPSLVVLERKRYTQQRRAAGCRTGGLEEIPLFLIEFLLGI